MFSATVRKKYDSVNSQRSFSLDGYWSRTAGLRGRLISLKTLSRRGYEQQLAAAILRCDADAVTKNCQLLSVSGFEKFFELVRQNSIAGLLLAGLAEMSASPMGQLAPNLVQVLQQQAAGEAANFISMNQRFLALQEAFSQAQISVMWLKGTALSRGLYASSTLRLSSDFDILVARDTIDAAIRCLESLGFQRIYDPAFYQTAGSAPLDLINPLDERDPFVSCDQFAYEKPGWPIVELRVDLLERGLSMQERAQVFSRAVSCTASKQRFLVPDDIDQLMLQCAELHKSNFSSWRNVMDVHLLGKRVAAARRGDELLRRSRLEMVMTSTAAALIFVADTMKCDYDLPLEELSAPLRRPLARYFSLTVEPRFLWNANGLFSLLLSIIFGEGSGRKMAALSGLLLPDNRFLSLYYNNGRTGFNAGDRLRLLLLHWWTLCLPSGAVRRTIGARLWPTGKGNPDVGRDCRR